MSSRRHRGESASTVTVARCLAALLLTAALLGRCAPVAAADRGLRLAPQSVVDQSGRSILLYKKSYALIIGISDYTNGWPDLPGVKKDVQAVRSALEAHGFEVVAKTDLDSAQFDRAFDDFISAYGNDQENRLLFYFAGHGYTFKTSYGEEVGYIVPTDAPNPNVNLPEFQRKAMEMAQIEIYAKRIQSKHALFLFDACFSGSLFALSRAVPEIIGYKTSRPVRQFITSGSAEETVPDESIFRTQFARALGGEGDTDGDGYVTGTELGEFLQKTVVNYSYNAQHPQYGKIRNPNLDKGDYIFIVPSRDKGPEAAVPVASPPEVTSSFEDLSVKAEWQAYLAKMEKAFEQVKAYGETDAEAGLRRDAWSRFEKTFAGNDPYSTRDEELRAAAAALRVAVQAKSPSGSAGTAVRSRTQQPLQTARVMPDTEFRIRKVIVKNQRQKVIEPTEDVYHIGKDETVTITVDVAHVPGHKIVVDWAAGKGLVPAVTDMSNFYTAKKSGSDFVTMYITDTTTGDALETSVAITVRE